jgi:predicted ferric reductase
MLRSPGASQMRDTDMGAFIGFLTLVIFGMWWHHGGPANFGASTVKTMTALAQITGLLCSEAGLFGLILITRTPHLERKFGLDRLFIWHRLLGIAMSLLLLLHIVFSVWAWATPDGVFTAISSLSGGEPYMALTAIGSLMVGLVTISSLKWFRNRLSYEMWYFFHLTVYIGLAFSFSHQIVLGSDFATDSLARWFWIGIHVAVIVWIIWSRWGGLVRAVLRPLRVTSVTHEARGVTSIVLQGSHLVQHRALAGQFYLLRQVARGRWWQVNPYSLSAVPTTAGLRFTIKSRGEASDAMTKIRVGTKVIAEGPYGVCTPDVVGDKKVLLVAGGVGIGPIVSYLEHLKPSSEPIVLYRAHSNKEVSHLDEIEALVKARNGRVHTLIGPRATLKVTDPFAPGVLKNLIPDIALRKVMVAGPESMVKAVQRGSRDAGVPAENIYAERAWW